MKKAAVILLMILFALLMPICTASQGYKANIYALKQSVHPGENAEFKIEIINNLSYTEDFTIYTQSMRPGWIYQKDYQLTIPPKGEKSTWIYITPDEKATAGNKGFYVYIYPEKNHNNSVRLESYVIVVRNEKLVIYNLKTPKTSYSPGETVTVSGTVKNVAVKEVSGYSVVCTLGTENNSVSVPVLDSGKTFDFKTNLTVNENLVGINEITVKVVSAEGKVEYSKKIKINIPSIQAVKIRKSDQNFFFWHTYKIAVKNTGNVKKDSLVVSAVVNRFKSYLFSSSQKYNEKSRVSGGTKYSWVITDLQPGETVTIQYRVNYWIVFLILIFAIIIAVLASYEFRNPSIMKVARKSKGVHTIHIFVKNNTKGNLTKVRVIDEIPGIAKLIENFETSKPSSIKRTEEGTILEWTLGNMHSGEERILSYKIKPILRVEGSVKLPKATLEYFYKNKDLKKRSNHALTNF